MDSTEAIVGIIAAIVGIIGLPVGIWFQFFRKTDDQGVKIPQPSMSPDERERLVRVELQLAELQEKTAAPPEGSAPLETAALAAQATAETERLLTEAVALQNENKEREAIERLLTAYKMDMPPEAKAELHLLAGNGFYHLSEYDAAEHHYARSLEASRRANSKAAQAAVLGNLGVIYHEQGDLAKAEDRHGQALAFSREIGDRLVEANALANLGHIYHGQGDLAKAEDHHHQALAIHREIEHRLGEAQDLGNLGNIYQEQHDLAKAEEFHLQALAILRDIGGRLGEARTLGNLGNVHSDQDNLGKAQDYYMQALTIQHEIGDRLGEANQLGNLGLLAEDRDDRNEACQWLEEALSVYDEIGAGGDAPNIVRAKLEELGCDDEPQEPGANEDAPGG